LEKNPQAVMFSGNVCGCLNEKSTAKEIAEEICWQYENSFHLLRKAMQTIAEPASMVTPDMEKTVEHIDVVPLEERIERMKKALEKWVKNIKERFPWLFSVNDTGDTSATAPDNEQSPRLVNVSALCIDAQGKGWQAFDCNNRARPPPDDGKHSANRTEKKEGSK